MRKFARSHWKILIAILLAIALATLTLETDSASPGPDLSSRLHAHVQAIPPTTPHAPEQAARHIETTLQGYGYRLHRQEYKAGGQKVRNIEVSLSSNARGARPERIFIVGAHYAPGTEDDGSGTAAVLELARLLKSMQPDRDTEVKFVFFVNEKPPAPLNDAVDKETGKGAPAVQAVGWYSQAQHGQRTPGLEKQYPSAGNFIAFVGTLESSAQVRQALAAFRAQPDFPAEGLAAPAHAMGMTLSDHSTNRDGYPALMITDTAFLRYPYFRTNAEAPDKPDYAAMARVVKGLARTIESLAGAAKT